MSYYPYSTGYLEQSKCESGMVPPPHAHAVTFQPFSRGYQVEGTIMVEGSIFTPSDLEDEEEKRKKMFAFDNEYEEAEFR